MVGLVVATHGELADEFIRTAESIVGKLEQVRAVSVGPTASMEETREKFREAIREVDTGDGVIVLTDMFGGTPANLALTFLDEKIEVLTGVNLPMLLKLTSCRSENMNLQGTAQVLTSNGQKNISLASELLRTRARTNRN